MKKWKVVNIWWSYDKNWWRTFLTHSVVNYKMLSATELTSCRRQSNRHRTVVSCDSFRSLCADMTVCRWRRTCLEPISYRWSRQSASCCLRRCQRKTDARPSSTDSDRWWSCNPTYGTQSTRPYFSRVSTFKTKRQTSFLCYFRTIDMKSSA